MSHSRSSVQAIALSTVAIASSPSACGFTTVHDGILFNPRAPSLHGHHPGNRRAERHQRSHWIATMWGGAIELRRRCLRIGFVTML